MKTLTMKPIDNKPTAENKPKMMALIRLAANDLGNPNNRKPESLHNYLVNNAGKWVEIDTNHVFENQYNTKSGFRIYDTHIQSIKNDVRVNLGSCKYCGTITKNALPCLKNVECLEYGVEDLSKCFFVKFPKGPDAIKKIDIRGNNRDFWSLYSVNDFYYRIIRRKNLEFILVNNIPYMVDIGYTHYKSARLSQNEIRIIDKAVKLINNA